MSRSNNISADTERSFICINCGISVTGSVSGTAHRNHCPYCLWSRHVDLKTGDRLAVCKGSMAPLSICETKGELSLIHRCEKCGTLRINRIAGDDNNLEMMKILMRLKTSVPFACEAIDNISKESCV